MNEEWRYTTKRITKYNPIYRDENGHYKKDEWIGFFQIGKVIAGEELTLELYTPVEQKYIKAATWFFEFHGCRTVVLRNIEKYNITDYTYDEKEELSLLYEQLDEEYKITIDRLPLLIKLILRELAWCELFCDGSEATAVRFGYDFYMYFNSEKDMQALFKRIEATGLFVD
jgi:hypothetical protein